MGWGKSIVECCFEDDSEELIHFDRISMKMFKYYWNQTIFFDLQQGSNPKNPPQFISYVKSKIEEYQSQYGLQPKEFERIEDKVNVELKELNRILFYDVCYRFLKVGNKEYDLYELDKKNRTIKVKNPHILKEYSGGKENGLFKEYHENGQLKIKTTYKDEKEDGPFERYCENGQLMIKTTHKDGEWDGPYEDYYENGQLRIKTTFQNGERDGPFEWYFKNGQLKEKGIYSNGVSID